MIKPDKKKLKRINIVTEVKSLVRAKFLWWNSLATSRSEGKYYHCDIVCWLEDVQFLIKVHHLVFRSIFCS